MWNPSTSRSPTSPKTDPGCRSASLAEPPDSSDFSSPTSKGFLYSFGMELLERGSELRVLHDAFNRANEGRGSTILISGEAGIGKTTLHRAFTSEISDAAAIWVGGCDDLITPRPLGVFRDMIESARLDVDGPPPSDRDAMIDAVVNELRSASRPTVLVVDDAHWADDASLDVVRYLGRRMAGMAAVLCVNYRPDGLNVEHPLMRVIGSMTGPEVTRLELKGLSDGLVAQLAADAGIEPGSLQSLTGGNPFLLTELLRSPETTVPVPVRDAILGRLNALPPNARALVDLLSQMPGGAEWSTIEALVGDVTPALHAVEDAGLIELASGAFRFRHELTRRAIDESLSDARRVSINRMVLEHLADSHGELHQLIHHAAGGADAAAISRYAPPAVEEAARAGSHYDTERLARLALEHVELLEPQTVARLLGQAAYASYMLNRFGDAARYADRAVQRWESLNRPAELGDALLTSSRMRTMTGEPELARAMATRAVEVLEPLGPNTSLALALSTMGNLDAIAARHAEAVEWAQRALTMAADLGLDDVAAHALNYLGISRVGLGDDVGFDDLRRAIELARRAGHTEYLFRASMNLGATLIWAGRHPEAMEHIELAASVASDSDSNYGVFHSIAQRCHVDLFTGKWDRAEADLRRLLDEEGDPVGVLVLPLSLLGRLLIRQGDPDGQTMIDEAWRIATETGQGFRIANAGLARIEAAWHLGSTEELARVGHELMDLAAESNTAYFEGEVRRYLRRAGVEVAPSDRCPPALAAGIAGRWNESATLWAALGAGYHQALELIESRDRETALRGLAILDDLGAVGTAGKVRQLLRDRGWTGLPRGPRPPTRDNPAQLTPRQLDVLVHLVDGKTSIEIGDALYVSSRTVDNHVAEILRKLDVGSRKEAVAAAKDKGIVQASDTS